MVYLFSWDLSFTHFRLPRRRQTLNYNSRTKHGSIDRPKSIFLLPKQATKKKKLLPKGPKKEKLNKTNLGESCPYRTRTRPGNGILN